MNRRELVQKIVLGGTVLVVIPSVLTSCSKDSGPNPDPNPGPGPGSPVTVDLSLAENAALNSTGGSKVVQTVLVINTGGGILLLLPVSVLTWDAL